LIPNRLADGSVNWTLGDISAILYRYAGLALPEAFARRFRFMAVHRKTAELHSALLGRPVEVIPFAMDAETRARPRASKEALTVGFLGAQRANKGFHLVPEIVSRLLTSRKDVRVIVQNSWGHMRKEMELLGTQAAADPRLRVIAGGLGPAEWAALLDELDVVVAPYDQNAYASSVSGITVEAIMNAIPSAVPRFTAIEEMLEEYGWPGVTFDRSEPQQVVDAVGRLIDDFARYAILAKLASETWKTRQGAAKFTQALLQAGPHR
jgi:hypothetical protein